MQECRAHCVHKEAVNKAKRRMKPDASYMLLAESFKVLGDPSRLRILHALLDEELCVCDISALLGMSESAISHQLRVLRNSRLVTYRKEGRIVYYTLTDKHVKTLLRQGIEHVEE